MSMVPVVDAIRTAVPAPNGMAVDDTCSEPMDYAPNTLYAWPETEQLTEEGDGSEDASAFAVTLALTFATTEAATQKPERAVSVAIDDATDAITDWVRTHRTQDAVGGPLWEDLQATVQYGGLRGFRGRGVRVRLSGHRVVS